MLIYSLIQKIPSFNRLRGNTIETAEIHQFPPPTEAIQPVIQAAFSIPEVNNKVKRSLFYIILLTCVIFYI